MSGHARPGRHPLCTCPELTWATLTQAPDRGACQGGSIAHPVVTVDDIHALLAQMTETQLRPALAEAGIVDAARYRLTLDRTPVRGCEHRTLVADFPSGHAPIVPECGCPA